MGVPPLCPPDLPALALLRGGRREDGGGMTEAGVGGETRVAAIGMRGPA